VILSHEHKYEIKHRFIWQLVMICPLY